MRKIVCLALTAIVVSPMAFAITPPSSDSLSSDALPAKSPVAANPAVNRYSATLQPFSRFALSGGISTGGINLQAATNVSNFLNLRVVGNVFNYTLNNFNTNGMTLNGKLNLASTGVSADLYPFPTHGLRFSPGILLHNQNSASANVTADGGTSFTLNSTTYYSSPSNPVEGEGSLKLNAQNPAFTMTAGWGNLISRRGGHWSLPFEIGAAFVGAPKVNLALNSGQVCQNPQGTVGCQNIANDPDVQSNLQAQIAKYQNDLNPLKVYPIISFGVGYSFKIR